MDKFIENCTALLEKITMQCDANWIAFSGGLDSSILGQIKKDQDLNALTIIAKDFIGTDLSYSQIIGKHIDIPLELKYVSIDEMLDAIKGTIKILKNFNDIEIRNSIVSYIYLNALKKKNITKIGIVKRVLTKKPFHSRGHKVLLTNGIIGRILKIINV